MREGPIGLRHPMRVLFLLDRLALALRGEDQLGGQPLRHVLLAPRAAVLDQPAHPQRRASLRPHLDRHLVGRAAHTPGLYFQRRLHVRQRLLEHVHAGLPGTLLDQIHRLVEHPLRQRLLPALHQVAHELGDGLAVVARIRRHRPPVRLLAAAAVAAALGRLAPYLDGDCLRSFTPAASSVPRMIWYRTPGRSLTRPPRIITIECSCRLCPSPGMYAVTSNPFVRRTRATLRSAEFGFFGVVVYTRVQTPRFCGLPRRCGAFSFFSTSRRPCRTSWLIVGKYPSQMNQKKCSEARETKRIVTVRSTPREAAGAGRSLLASVGAGAHYQPLSFTPAVGGCVRQALVLSAVSLIALLSIPDVSAAQAQGRTLAGVVR